MTRKVKCCICKKDIDMNNGCTGDYNEDTNRFVNKRHFECDNTIDDDCKTCGFEDCICNLN